METSPIARPVLLLASVGLGCAPVEPYVCTWRTTAGLGHAYCHTVVEDVELKVVPPDGAPTALAVFLHGDTADGYFEDWGFEWLLDDTRSSGLLLVAALAPNRCSWWRSPEECAWEIEDEDGYNADALSASLDWVSTEWDVPASGVRFVGYSGGSTFLTGQFLPLYGARHPGMVVANCGGEAPTHDFAWEPTAALRAASPLVFTWGSEDFLGGADGEPDYIGQAITAYERARFPVSALELDGYGHCDAGYDWDERTLELWSSYVDPLR